MPIRRDNDIRNANLGLYLGMSPAARPRRAMVDCLNVRIKQGRVIFDNLGWQNFPSAAKAVNLDGKPVLLSESFELRNGDIKTVFGNTTDLFEYDDNAEEVLYLSQRYQTGTVDVTNGSPTVTGTGTTWTTNLKAGDFFHAGAVDQRALTAVWYEILSVDSDTQITLTANYAEATAAGVAYTGRITFTGSIVNPWVFETFYNGSDLGGPAATGDRIYFCNTIDGVVGWDGSATEIYVPNLANVETTRWMVRHKNKMIYVAPTVGGTFAKYSIRTSDIGKPEDTVNGEAVELIVHDGPDEIQAAYPIGEQLAIYSKENITLAQSVALPLVYVFRTVVTGYGALSPRGVAVYPDFHDFVSEDRQYRFNGSRAVPMNDHVWRDVIRRITPERNNFLHNHFVDELGELMWAVPLTTDNDTLDGPVEQCYTAHYMERTFQRTEDEQSHTRRELPALCFGSFLRPTTLTWDEIAEQWQDFNFRWNDSFFFAQYPITLFGMENGDVMTLNTLPTKNGTAMDSYARFARIVTGSVEVQGVIRRIYPYLEQMVASTDTVQIRLYGTNVLDGVATLLSDQSITTALDTSRRFVSPRRTARFVEIEIGNIAQINYWATSGYAVDTVRGGAR